MVLNFAGAKGKYYNTSPGLIFVFMDKDCLYLDDCLGYMQLCGICVMYI